jgi:plasmid maintenance system antidote protein VapI
MTHPWHELIQEIRNNGWTQKQFAILLWKKVSEVNELIKWKRNITILWDLSLSNILWFPERYWLNKQIDYDYDLAREIFDKNKLNKEKEILQDSNTQNIFTQKNKDNESIFRDF